MNDESRNLARLVCEKSCALLISDVKKCVELSCQTPESTQESFAFFIADHFFLFCIVFVEGV